MSIIIKDQISSPLTSRCGNTIELWINASSTINSTLTYQWEKYTIDEVFIENENCDVDKCEIIVEGDKKWKVKITEVDSGEYLYAETIIVYAECYSLDNEFCDAFISTSGYSAGTACKGCRGYCWGEGYSGYSGQTTIPSWKDPEWENLSSHPGVKITSENGISGYEQTDPENNFIDVDSIKNEILNTIKELTYLASKESHLNPQVDDETDILQIFDDYELDINNQEDQIQYDELQRYEATEFSEFMFSEWLKKLMNPIDRAIGCLHSLINSGRVVIGKAMSDIPNSSFVYLYDGIEDIYLGRKEILVYLANYGRNSQTPLFRYAMGFVTKDYKKGDCVTVILKGVNKFYDESEFDIGKRVFLSSNGSFSTSVPDSQDDSFPEDYQLICQELGHVISEDEIQFTYHVPVILNCYEFSPDPV